MLRMDFGYKSGKTSPHVLEEVARIVMLNESKDRIEPGRMSECDMSKLLTKTRKRSCERIRKSKRF
jgi:hypothetical protein